jgi:cytoskeletal protein RodZ
MSTTLEPETREEARAAEADAVPAQPETITCPSCGAPAEPGQLMCLECGSRLALDYQRPPTWRLPAAIVGVIVLLAGAAVAFALAQVTDNAGKTAQSPAQPQAAQTGAQGAQAAPGDSQAPTPSQPSSAPSGGTPPAETTPAETTPTPAPTTAAGWPAGKDAFTVVLASMPTEAAAKDKLQKAKDAGITGAAILHSDDFPTLNPGYWVVFDGQFDSVSQATSQAEQDRGKGEFSDAYPRFVSKNQDAKP